MEEDDPLIHVSLTAITPDKNAALKVVEVFSRMLVGLALDGVNINLSVMSLDDTDEFEEEQIEGDFD